MGALTYDGTATKFDDRLLAHLQIVIVQRLRQRRSFLMSWLNALEVGDGRTSIWVHDQASIRFTFEGSRSPEIDEHWLQVLGTSADGPRGLIVMNDQGAVIRSSGGAR
jgi:hypothetical protein